MIRVKNYLFNLNEVREVRGADGSDKGLYINFVGGLVKFYDDISFDVFYEALNQEEK